jgi:hypothetical protein
MLHVDDILDLQLLVPFVQMAKAIWHEGLIGVIDLRDTVIVRDSGLALLLMLCRSDAGKISVICDSPSIIERLSQSLLADRLHLISATQANG